MSPIRTLETRFPRLGYLSLGFQTKTKDGKNIRPTVSDTIVVHSDGPELLEPFAREYGGGVQKSLTWTEEKERWLVVTESTSMPVIVPSDNPDLVSSQWYEAWASSGLVRRCDGVDCVLWRKEPDKSKEQVVGEISDEMVPCICDAEDLEEKLRCKPTVRLNVVPVDVAAHIKGIGVWTVRSTGFFTNAELKGDLELIRSVVGALGSSVPLELTVEQVNSSRGLRPKFRLNLATTPAEAFALAEAKRPVFAPPPTHVLPAGTEEPVGSFVDKPKASPDARADDVGSAGDSSEAARVDGASPAPDVLVIKGVHVPYVGGEKRSSKIPAMRPPQVALIQREAKKLEWDQDDILAGIKHYTGHKFDDVSRAGAEVFIAFLRDQVREREQVSS